MGLSYRLEHNIEHKEKLINKLDPRTKLVWYALMIYFSLSCETAVQLCLVLLVGITTSLVLTGSLKQYKVMIVIMLLLGLQMMILQLLFCREGVLLYQWGIVKIYSEAIPLTITGILKATIIVFASMHCLCQYAIFHIGLTYGLHFNAHEIQNSLSLCHASGIKHPFYSTDEG